MNYYKIKCINFALALTMFVGGQCVYGQLTQGQEALLRAVNEANVDDVARLLDEQVNPHFLVNDEGESLLFAVMEVQRTHRFEYGSNSDEALEIFGLLLDAGVNPDVLDAEGDPIINATIDHPEFLQALIEHGVDPNAYNPNGWAALHNAAEAGLVDAVELLVGAPGIDLNQQVRCTEDATFEGVVGMTALHFAAEGGTDSHNVILDMLRDARANPMLVDAQNRTPARLAELGGHQNVALLLYQDIHCLMEAYAFN